MILDVVLGKPNRIKNHAEKGTSQLRNKLAKEEGQSLVKGHVKYGN